MLWLFFRFRCFVGFEVVNIDDLGECLVFEDVLLDNDNDNDKFLFWLIKVFYDVS